MQKRVMAINDISCVGRCSLTVALPIISAFGLECSVIPTAILSTHTGGFTGYTFRDLTDDMSDILNHYKTLNLKTDALVSGYLGSSKQIDKVIDYIDYFKDSTVIVDPVMADNGKLYPGFDLDFPKLMCNLVKRADIIVPNLTEASLLLDIPYNENYTEEDIKRILVKLANLGPKIVVITGISFDENLLGAYLYNKETNSFYYYANKRILGYYHGTGDVFTSTFAGAYIHGLSLEKSLEKAVDFTYQTINDTKEADLDPKYGVIFEKRLSDILK